MFDPSEIISAAASAHQMGTEARNQTTTAFMVGTPAMPVTANHASSVIDNVHAHGQQMLNNLNSVKTKLDSQVAAHQAKQRSAIPGNFDPDMNDLRPTDAQGFPQESPEQFLAAFKF